MQQNIKAYHRPAITTCLLLPLLLFAQQLLAQAPAITSVEPSAAAIGATVTINGTNFSPAANNNTVFFGAVKAIVTSATANALQVKVPAGASYTPVTVTVNSLTGASTQPFNVTFKTADTVFSTSSYTGKINITVGSNPRGIAICDFDGDGKPDVIVANQASNNLSVFRNTTTGSAPTFSNVADQPVGSSPFTIAVGDLDGDGRPDLAVANFNNGNASNVSVLNNTSTVGNISFAPAINYETGNGTEGVAIGDLDQDGKPELVVASGNSATMSIFKNTTVAAGNITFAPKIDLSTRYHAGKIAIADFNGDGLPDLATAEFEGYVSVFRNNTTGGVMAFAERVDIAAGIYVTGITTGDFDSDGLIDIAVVNFSANRLFILKNTSRGIYSTQFDTTSYATGYNADYVSAADIDGDGKPDLAVSNNSSVLASLFKNTSTPGNISFAKKVDYAAQNGPSCVVAGDLNGDGKPELVISNQYTASISVLTNSMATLPLSLLNFKGSQAKNMAQLTWQTANEQNTAYFSVERSGDGSNFSGIATVAAAGNSTTIKNYAYNDVITSAGTIYYRLKMVDADGRFSYSKIVPIGINSLFTFAVYPNPATYAVTVNFLPANSTSTIQLTTMDGKVVKTVTVGRNDTRATVTLNGLAAGAYNITFYNGQKTQTKLLVVQ